MTTRQELQLAAQRVSRRTGPQTEVSIYNSCLEKYKKTNQYIEELEEKKRKLEDEISHLRQKQVDRAKFLDEVRQRHQKN